MTTTCPMCLDTGIVHYLRCQGAPWAERMPCRGNPPCGCVSECVGAALTREAEARFAAAFAKVTAACAKRPS